MGTRRLMKSNPAFLNDQELIDSFVVREADMDLILEVIGENSGEANQHLLIIGPRGSGKTTLVRRVAAEVRRRPETNQAWYPLVFGEDSYEVASAGQFWLEALHFLGEQTGQERWRGAYKKLLEEPSEENLRQLALAKLMDFADQENKRILLIVENLNLVLGEQLSDDDAWKLRHALMNESRLMLLGTATARFEQIDNSGKALYETLTLHQLEPLSLEECQTVWRMVTGQDLPSLQARAISILTGGNPRLLTILSNFGANRSFQALMDDLTLLVDDHTDSFKSNMESLPPVERKVFACLATLWEDATAAQVAAAARLTPSQASAHLIRLVGRGVVSVVSGKKRKKTYQLAERLYNIYYLMRRGQDSERVRAVVHFMVRFYGCDHLHEAMADIAREACGLEPERRKLSFLALEELLRHPEAVSKRHQLMTSLPEELASFPDLPDSLRPTEEDTLRADLEANPKKVLAWVSLGTLPVLDGSRISESEAYFRKAVELEPKLAVGWSMIGHVLMKLQKRPEESEYCLRKALALDPSLSQAWIDLGLLIAFHFNRPEEGANYVRKAIDLKPDDSRAWGVLGKITADKLVLPVEGEAYLSKAVELDPSLAVAWADLGQLRIFKLNNPKDGEAALRKALEFRPDFAGAWAQLGWAQAFLLNRPEDGEYSFLKSLELNAKLAVVWHELGRVQAYLLNRPKDGENSLYRALALDPNIGMTWCDLGCLQAFELGNPEAGEASLRKAVALDTSISEAWGALGIVLANKPESKREAISALKQSVTIAPHDFTLWSLLIALQLTLTDKTEALEELLAEYHQSTNRTAEALNNLAYTFLEEDYSQRLTEVETWAREAVAKEPENSIYHGTLARALAYQGKAAEALKEVAIPLQDVAVIERNINPTTEIFAAIAAAGEAQAALDLLEDSPSASVLEPLVVALKMYLGQEPSVPQEVREVAKDVVKRIEEWRERFAQQKMH